MNERWTTPRKGISPGPFPQSHLVADVVTWSLRPVSFKARCGRSHSLTEEQLNACTDEPPPYSSGATCGTCLLLRNRDVRGAEADAPADTDEPQP